MSDRQSRTQPVGGDIAPSRQSRDPPPRGFGPAPLPISTQLCFGMSSSTTVRPATALADRLTRGASKRSSAVALIDQAGAGSSPRIASGLDEPSSGSRAASSNTCLCTRRILGGVNVAGLASASTKIRHSRVTRLPSPRRLLPPSSGCGRARATARALFDEWNRQPGRAPHDRFGDIPIAEDEPSDLAVGKVRVA